MPKVLIAQIICDRKASSLRSGSIDAIYNIKDVDWEFYLNIQSREDIFLPDRLYNATIYDLKAKEKKFYWDKWAWSSNWKPGPAYDQDVERLIPICIARNMALEFASRREDISHVLFIDADVIPEPDGLKRLLAQNLPLIGGLVHGRGIHKDAVYKSHEEEKRGELTRCAYGTCGYMLIARSVFSKLRFRIGQASHTDTPITMSEDPNFCIDAKTFLDVDFWIDNTVKAEHWDDPNNPLTQEGVTKMEIKL